MSITTRNPGPNDLATISNALERLLRTDSQTRDTVANTALGASHVEIAAAHSVYTMTVDEVLSPTFPESSKDSGRRYIAIVGDEQLGLVGLLSTEEQDQPQFSGIRLGSLATAFVRAIEIGEELPPVAEADYELRALHIPALYVTAIWLHGNTDIFITVPPCPPTIVAYAVFSPAELTEALRELALTAREFDESSLFPDN